MGGELHNPFRINRSEKFVSLLITIVISLALIFFILMIAFPFIVYDIDCIKDSAKRICSDKDLYYNGDLIWILGTTTFDCIYDKRSMEGERFKFLESDLERCKK